MIEDRYYVEPAVWMVDVEDLKRVRTAVFIVEQQVPESEEWDSDDPISEHALARTPDRTPIGTARLTPDGRIGRMAVMREWRGAGVGAALLRFLIERAQARGMSRLSLHAQTHAIPFYEKAGFVAEGPEYLECEIPHRTMVLTLATSEPLPARDQPPPSGQPQRLSASRSAELADAVQALLGAARHEICIYTRDFEPALYERVEILDACRRVALSGRGASLRILVQDPVRAVRDGHRLLDLAQRLSSVIQIRRPVQEDLQYAAAFVLNDAGGFLYRSFGDRPEAEGDLYYPPRRNELKRYFDEVWERAEQPPELRRLSL